MATQEVAGFGYLPILDYAKDANGIPVSSSQQVFEAYRVRLPEGGGYVQYAVNPNYAAPVASTTQTTPAPLAPQFTFTFDTIGQVIARSIGHCTLPLRIIWAQGINQSGDTTTAPTLTFAAALCAPLDPGEEGVIGAIYAGSTILFDPTQGGVVIPDGTSDTNAALLQDAINNAIIYPGDEQQLPSPLIQSDKGVDLTNAFRGLRYIIFPNYPLGVGSINALQVQWQRTNSLSTSTYSPAAVEFAAGSA